MQNGIRNGYAFQFNLPKQWIGTTPQAKPSRAARVQWSLECFGLWRTLVSGVGQAKGLIHERD